MLFLGKGHYYEFHNVENQKEHRKIWRQSQHRKALLKGSERRKRKRSERQKELITTTKITMSKRTSKVIICLKPLSTL